MNSRPGGYSSRARSPGAASSLKNVARTRTRCSSWRYVNVSGGPPFPKKLGIALILGTQRRHQKPGFLCPGSRKVEGPHEAGGAQQPGCCGCHGSSEPAAPTPSRKAAVARRAVGMRRAQYTLNAMYCWQAGWGKRSRGSGPVNTVARKSSMTHFQCPLSSSAGHASVSRARCRVSPPAAHHPAPPRFWRAGCGGTTTPSRRRLVPGT